VVCDSPLCVPYSSYRAGGLEVASSFGSWTGQPLVPSGCGRGLSGQGTSLTLSLVVHDLEVSGCVEMIGSGVHAHSKLSSSWWARLFLPQLSKYIESTLKSKQGLPQSSTSFV
jgi:hypothetical protein